MIKRLLILTLVIFTSTSCVSSKLYKELEGKYSNLKNDYDFVAQVIYSYDH